MKLVRSGIYTHLLIAAFALIVSCKNKPENINAIDSTKIAAAKPMPGSAIKLDSSKRYIFLTWDDSPQPPGTTNCKKVFQQQSIKATFFVVGFNQVGPFKKRIIDSLRNDYPEFLIANHSFSHGFKDNYKKFYQLTDSALNDFLKNESELQIPVKIIRLPGRNTWASNGQIHGQEAKTPLIRKLDSLGYKIIGWDLEWSSQKGKKAPMESADEMIKRVNQHFEDGNTNEQNSIVILSHDRLFEQKAYADSLNKFISVLKQDPRNVFETIDHYPLVQKK